MVEAKGLSRYYGRNKNITKALDSVDFVLPDSGLVFIVGKSGSGKSTLLNLLCGLDDATSGSILVDGTDICRLKPHELDNYRNYFVGIIYQNYNLFDDDTVINNIKLSSNIAENDVSDEEIFEMIEKVDLKGKEYSLVRQLSGGEKQRVAVARALIKNPHMIIADEPTGNLDTKTSAIIFDMLREISNEKLVVIVSHDMESARTYGDRIIEISDGKIVSDCEKNETYSTEYESIEISRTCLISEERMEEINEVIKDKGAKLLKSDDKYVPFDKEVISKKCMPDFKRKNKSWKNSFVLSYKFFCSAWVSLIIAVVISSIIIGLLVIANQFVNFDGEKNTLSIAKEYGIKSAIYDKINITATGQDKTHYLKVDDSEIQKFRDAGYNGNIYPIYAAPLYNGYDKLGTGKIEKDKIIYARSGQGVMVTNRDYLERVFNGLELAAGTLENAENTTSIIVTDYFADSILYWRAVKREDGLSIISDDPDNIYKNILGIRLSHRYTIGAIIKTDYKEKYASILVQAEEVDKSDILKAELYPSKEFLKFDEEVKNSLAIAYSLNPNFISEFVSGNDVRHFYICGKVKSGSHQLHFNYDKSISVEDDINNGEIYIEKDTFSNLFPNEVFDINNTKIISINQNGNVKTYKVAGIYTSSRYDSSICKMSVKDAESFMLNTYVVYSLCFDDLLQQSVIDEVARDNGFYSKSTILNAVGELEDIVNIFSALFTYISVILVIAVAVFAVFYALRVIRKNQYRLGVYKSLGYSVLALENAALLNNLYLIVAIFVVSIIASSLMSGVANGLMIQSFTDYFGNNLYSDFTFFSFSVPTVSIFVGIIAALILISTFVPIMAIRRIKPNTIINKAE